jgi:hypothetical protein
LLDRGDTKESAKYLQQFLTLRMNGASNSAEVKRVTRFIELFQKAQTLHEGFRLFFKDHEEMVAFLRGSVRRTTAKPNYCSGYEFHGSPELQKLNSDLDETLSELNRCMSRYKSFPWVFHGDYGFPSLFVSETFERSNRAEYWEHLSIRILCRRNGDWIDRVRRCKACERWFFAVVEHQTHCSDRCRKRRAATSDEFRDKRRLYMREYRRREKEQERRATADARRELRRR